ncbi:MAG: MBL fold metallo-hydrolase [Clostridiales bacterium]|nr:MBL fold metallo-hydrolase [Clostridiales bacterium]
MEVLLRPLGECQTNCYIIEKTLMIDPGDDIGALERFISDTGARIDTVIITHGHFDHLLGAAHMQEKYTARVLISEADAPALSDPKKAIVPEYTLTPFTPIAADGLLSPGKTRLLGRDCVIISTPGHTPGGICLYFPEDKVMFTGDTLFAHGYGRTDFPGGDMRQLIASLRGLLQMDGDIRIYSGHGESALLRQIKQGYRP